jgi:hypothetical protein
VLKCGRLDSSIDTHGGERRRLSLAGAPLSISSRSDARQILTDLLFPLSFLAIEVVEDKLGEA